MVIVLETHAIRVSLRWMEAKIITKYGVLTFAFRAQIRVRRFRELGNARQ